MVAYVNGILESIEEGNAVVDVNGIGINVNISGSTMDRMPGIGEVVKLYTYTNVKEDAFTLFGFLSRDELGLFKLLITVNGIGPKGGLAILSVMSPDDLRFAIIAGDSASIAKAPGIGKKTAERITLELKDKIKVTEDSLLSQGGDSLGGELSGENSSAKDETVAALVALGYNQSDAMRAVRKVLGSDVGAAADTEDLLKLALKEMFYTAMEKKKIVTNARGMAPEANREDIKIEGSLRPQNLDSYIGQKKIKESLKIYIEAAKKRGDCLDHLLFYGPPGLGKTTLAGIIANEMGVHIKITSGPAIEKPGDMAAILNNLQEGDILFVDEIHRLNRQVEEVLYPAMEDYAIDIMIGKGPTARSIRLDLPHFTLIGATTRAGMLSAPLRDRFGMIHRMEFYDIDELCSIILQSAKLLDVEVDKGGAVEMARRSRGTPRLANRILKRVRDFAQVKFDGKVTGEVAMTALDLMDVDKMGLDHTDRNLLFTMINKFAGKPVGLDTLAAAIGEDPGTIEDVYEPYLIKNGFINRTPRGRVVTDIAYAHLGLENPVDTDI